MGNYMWHYQDALLGIGKALLGDRNETRRVPNIVYRETLHGPYLISRQLVRTHGMHQPISQQLP